MIVNKNPVVSMLFLLILGCGLSNLLADCRWYDESSTCGNPEDASCPDCEGVECTATTHTCAQYSEDDGNG